MIYLREDAKETHQYECPNCGYIQYYTESVEEVLPCPNCRIGEKEDGTMLAGAPSIDEDGNPITYKKIHQGWNTPGRKPTDVPEEIRFKL